MKRIKEIIYKNDRERQMQEKNGYFQTFNDPLVDKLAKEITTYLIGEVKELRTKSFDMYDYVKLDDVIELLKGEK